MVTPQRAFFWEKDRGDSKTSEAGKLRFGGQDILDELIHGAAGGQDADEIAMRIA